MFFTPKRVFLGIAVGLYLYLALPATAVLFYELHHMTGVDAVYWGYSAFKFAGYYFGIWPYQLLACVLRSGQDLCKKFRFVQILTRCSLQSWVYRFPVRLEVSMV